VNLLFRGNDIGISNEIDKHHNYPVSHTPWAHIVHMGYNRWLSCGDGEGASGRGDGQDT
jgi:hypothetical protein